MCVYKHKKWSTYLFAINFFTEQIIYKNTPDIRYESYPSLSLKVKN